MISAQNIGSITFNLAALVISMTCVLYTLMMRTRIKFSNRLFMSLILIVIIDSLTGILCEVVVYSGLSYGVKLFCFHVFQYLYFFTHFAIAPILALYIIISCGVSFLHPIPKTKSGTISFRQRSFPFSLFRSVI